MLQGDRYLRNSEEGMRLLKMSADQGNIKKSCFQIFPLLDTIHVVFAKKSICRVLSFANGTRIQYVLER
jgi:hypothetical protein